MTRYTTPAHKRRDQQKIAKSLRISTRRYTALRGKAIALVRRHATQLQGTEDAAVTSLWFDTATGILRLVAETCVRPEELETVGTQRRWTHRFPKVDGYYWLKGWTVTRGSSAITVVWPPCIVRVNVDCRVFYTCGNEMDYVVDNPAKSVMWYGPLEELGKDGEE
jgi:hypothetical protein